MHDKVLKAAKTRLNCIWAFCLVLCLAGCGIDADEIVEQSKRALNSRGLRGDVLGQNDPTQVSPFISADSIASGEKDLLISESSAGQEDNRFQFPSPERTNPFVINGIDEEIQQQQLDGRTAIRVLGFVDTGTPKAMLEVEGKLKTLAIGESISGVSLETIDPPFVTLKQKNLTWTVSIFDRKSSVSNFD